MNILVALAAVGGLFRGGDARGRCMASGGSSGSLSRPLPFSSSWVEWWRRSWGGRRAPSPSGFPPAADSRSPWIGFPIAVSRTPIRPCKPLGRMALEVLFFRSLLRNTKAELVDGKTVGVPDRPSSLVGRHAHALVLPGDRDPAHAAHDQPSPGLRDLHRGDGRVPGDRPSCGLHHHPDLPRWASRFSCTGA